MRAAPFVTTLVSLLLCLGCRRDAHHDTVQASGQSLSVPVPSARWGHGFAYDSARERMVLFGGQDASGAFVGDTWEWDGSRGTWTLRATTGPAGRYGHAMVYDSARRKIVLFGGFNLGVFGCCFLGDTWEWDGDAGTWTQRANTGPSPRYAQLIYDSARRTTVLFGGVTRNVITYTALDDTWEWDGVAGTWTQRSPTNQPLRALFPRVGL